MCVYVGIYTDICACMYLCMYVSLTFDMAACGFAHTMMVTDNGYVCVCM